MVVVSGGVSVGPHDHVKPALAALGVREVFWGVALQPGKPTWFGTLRGPARLRTPRQPGVGRRHVLAVRAPCAAGAPGRSPSTAPPRHATLGRRRPAQSQPRAGAARPAAPRGHTVAVPNGPQGSNIVSSLLGADALAMIPPGEGELEAGARVALEELPH